MSNYFKLREAEHIAICRIMYLLEPSTNHSKYNDAEMVASYETWNSLRGLPYPPLALPPDDEEHEACRRMWAVEMSRRIQSEYLTKGYLSGAVAAVVEARASLREKHEGCACTVPYNRWMGEDVMRILAPLNPTHNRDCQCGGPLTCPVQGSSFNSAVALMLYSSPRDSVYAPFCTCDLCHRRPLVIAAGTKAAAEKAEGEFAKNLFQKVQGVKNDNKCPHGMPFYACMPCRH